MWFMWLWLSWTNSRFLAYNGWSFIVLKVLKELGDVSNVFYKRCAIVQGDDVYIHYALQTLAAILQHQQLTISRLLQKIHQPILCQVLDETEMELIKKIFWELIGFVCCPRSADLGYSQTFKGGLQNQRSRPQQRSGWICTWLAFTALGKHNISGCRRFDTRQRRQVTFFLLSQWW